MDMSEHLSRGEPVLEHLWKQFRALDYRPEFLERAIPSWWTAEAVADPNGLDHLKLLLAQRLGLDIEALRDRDQVLPIAPMGMRFKRSSNLHSEEPPDPNLAFLSRVARFAAGAIEPSHPLPAAASTLHSAILAQTGRPFVDLEAILSYCWSRNIAVVHVDAIPMAKKGLDALVYGVKDRFVIIVLRKMGTEAWADAAFTIAHELAHIALGHVTENLAIIDDSSEAERARDTEREADTFAAQLMSGGRYRSTWRQGAKSGATLAERALRYQKEWQIDAGHIILRAAFDKDVPWANARAACKHLPQHSDVPRSFINTFALSHLDASRISKDAQEMLESTIRPAA